MFRATAIEKKGLQPRTVLKSEYNMGKSEFIVKKQGGDFMLVCKVTSVMSDSVLPWGLQPARIPCPWDFPVKNTGLGCHALFRKLIEGNV